MSDEQLKAFLEAVTVDAGLQEQLNAASDADAVVAIAKAAGFVISTEELARALSEAQAEISERFQRKPQRFQMMSWLVWLVV